jgi:arsenate reductase
MSKVTMYHNPNCGTSRNTLAMIRSAGIEPEVIEYLKTPPSRDALREIAQATGEPLRNLIRSKEALYTELGLDDQNKTDDQLLDAMLTHPVLINRPIVVTDTATRLCRPSEQVLEILPQPQQRPFIKEDGQVVIDAQGRRLSD